MFLLQIYTDTKNARFFGKDYTNALISFRRPITKNQAIRCLKDLGYYPIRKQWDRTEWGWEREFRKK